MWSESSLFHSTTASFSSCLPHIWFSYRCTKVSKAHFHQTSNRRSKSVCIRIVLSQSKRDFFFIFVWDNVTYHDHISVAIGYASSISNGTVHLWLCESRIIHFIMTPSTETDEIYYYIFSKLLTIFKCYFAGFHYILKLTVNQRLLVSANTHVPVCDVTTSRLEDTIITIQCYSVCANFGFLKTGL